MFATRDTPHGHGPEYMTQMVMYSRDTPHGHGPEYMTLMLCTRETPHGHGPPVSVHDTDGVPPGTHHTVTAPST